jgi:CRP-like cAMP-binding protein
MARSDAAVNALKQANYLLAALPAREFARLAPLLEIVALPARGVLYESGQPIRYVHFPTAGVVSLLTPPERQGVGIEVGVLGREGMTGLPLFLGVSTTLFRCVVQVPGQALRMRARDFQNHLSPHSLLHRLLLHYTHAFLAQVSQSAACNALHPVVKRLARWVLTVQERAGNDRFPLTHEFLAAMLGVRRASVSEAARRLQQAGLIRYVRGEVMVQDRQGLESAACGCHRLIQAEFSRPLA